MQRAARLHAIMEELRRVGDRGRTAEQLAHLLEVTTRTIKRDIATLQAAGSAIAAQAGPGGGYFLIGQPSLPPVNFTSAQAVAIAVALAMNRDAPYAQDGRAALAKLLDVMDPASRQQVEKVGARVWVRGADGSAATIRRAIEEGVERNLVVSLGYTDGDGNRSLRRVEPQLLAFTDGHWYVIGWCLTRNAVRWFRLDRVTDAAVTTRQFEPRDPAVFGEPPADAFPIRG
ncbi:helix-turn-helix transcriptional regulator [Antrihabitans stalactiti]|uniref:WYL domain-containing protein n=1 Tax=Antrihabitans stalactiti TaxID=2584121 RepID=A0A848K9Y0_9NOCA|nr:WYL domain-containing protein [Antrihabitans stalactiti]NMN95149.1 WYL domain-containing protein [Antrihabitans stalactiti]